MDVTELDSVQAARWVWESLWSTGRHAKVNILDVALFDASGDRVAPGSGAGPTIARWLFTAKDGRIMKKAAHNASIAALKQSFLGRVLRGALEHDDSSSRDSRASSKAAARSSVFGTALLSSGKIVELDEGAWATLIVGGKGWQDDVSAVTALVPGNSVDHHPRGSPQRVTCEFRVKMHGTTVGKGGKECVDDAFSTPTQVSMKTYIQVSSGLLREEGEQVDEGADNKHHEGGGRLVSRVKATNHEVETKLRRIVQWVQEARGVKVLGMTAMFAVLPSLGSGAPGVWLERVLNVRMVPKDVGAAAAVAAPFADAPPICLAQRTMKAPGGQEPSAKMGPQGSVPSTPAAEECCQPPEAVVLTRQQSEEPENNSQPRAAGGMSLGAADSETLASAEERSSSAFARAALPVDVGESAKNRSITSILSAGTDAVLSIAERPLPRDGGSTDTALSTDNGSGRVPSTATTAASVGRRDRSAVGPDFFSQSAVAARDRCGGDFCSYSYEASSDLSAPTKGIDGGAETRIGAALNWNDVNMSDKEGRALLDVADKTDVKFSLSYKSVVLARVEAKAGHDVYWGEGLRECYREGGRRAGRLEELSPVQIYKEVSVCRRCHSVYQRLDRLREEADRTGGRPAGISGGDGILARVDATAVHGRRTAAAEAGAATLSAEVTAMLRDVDARTGKLGIEAGIIWRRRLSKSKSICGAEFPKAHSQALLIDRLARPKPRESDDIVGPPGRRRQVKSQGDTPECTGSRHQRRTGEPPLPPRSLPLLPRQSGGWARSSGRGLLEPSNKHRFHEEETSGFQTLPPGIPRRSAWKMHENVAKNADTSDTAADSSKHGNERGSMPRRCGIEGETPGINSGGGPYGGSGGSTNNLTINAIEAMLEDGGEAYLPERVGDLPEASEVMGIRATSPGERGVNRLSTSGGKRPRRRSDRREKNKLGGGARSGDDKRRAQSSDCRSTTGNSVFGDDEGDRHGNEGGVSSLHRRRRVERSSAERFLHPWQRMLEAQKREAGRADEDDFMMQKERQQRRRDARRAAVASVDCRRAGRRVAVRLGRHQRRRPHRHGGRDETLLLDNSNGRRKNIAPEGKFGAFNGGDDSGGLERASGSCSYDGREGCLDQLRDTLGWARKTFGALVRRLQDRGVIALETTAVGDKKNGQNGGNLLAQVVTGIRSQLAAFDNTCAIFGAEVARSTTAASTTSLQSQCDAACDSFESDFCRLIDELTAEGKTEFREPPSSSLGEESSLPAASFDDKAGGGHSQSDLPHEGSVVSGLPDSTARATKTSVSNSGFCPSCSVLPVARRCLDCEGGGADRDRCSGCFVRDHRDPGRRNHRFLRVSGVGGGTGSASTNPEHAPYGGGPGATADKTTAIGIASRVDPVASSSSSSSCAARCSMCGDLAAARRCRDCRVDTCAACHFLAHRTPSRQAHVTEFVGETAVAMQEALHQQRQLGTSRRISGGEIYHGDEGSTAAGGVRQPTLENGEDDDAADDGHEMGGSSKGGGVFGDDAAQSLAQVRGTVDGPVVRPVSSAQSRLQLTPSRGGGDPAVARDAVAEEEHSEAEKDTGSGGEKINRNESVKDNKDEADYHKEGGGKEEAEEEDGLKELDEDENAGGVSSTDEDTDDEGMMWCPLNIAKVDLSASTSGEGADEAAPPSLTPIQPVESDLNGGTISHTASPSTPGDGSKADPATSPNT